MARLFLDSDNRFSRRRYFHCVTCWCALPFLPLLSCGSGRRHVDLGLSRVSWKASSADVYFVDTRTSRIAIYGRNSNGNRIRNFENLRDYADLQGNKLAFATNGGMFHAGYDPVGLLVQDGIERSPINLTKGEGNFFLKPNGVFLISGDGRAAIVPSENFSRFAQGVRAATQSGPLLVIDGRINSVFRAGSANRFVRSGVGVIDPHTVVFALSSKPVNFWDFARLFRDVLGCKNALYLDGAISKFYLPSKKEFAGGGEFGVLIGVTEIP